MKTLFALCLAALLSATFPVHAAQPGDGKIAIVSRVGDALSVVITQERAAGSHLDPRRTDTIPSNGPALDHLAMGVAQDTVAQVLPRATVLLLAVPPAGSAWDPDRLLAADGRVNWGDGVQPALQKAGISHVLVLAKHRSAARLMFQEGSLGNGTLQGLGFYVDLQTRTRRADTGARGTGYIAPFAYLRLVLVEVDSARVVREAELTESMALSAADSPSGDDPWGMLKPEAKVALLRDVMSQGMKRVMPTLLGAAN